MRKVFILIVLPFAFLSCSSTGQQKETTKNQLIEQVDLSVVWDKPQDVMLSSIADSIFYIPLEKTQGSYLGDNIDVTFLRDNLLVYENNQTLRLYDKNGKYLLTFGGKGKGPGEYMRGSNFICDEKNDRVYILDGNLRKVIVYNLHGVLIHEIKLERLASQIILNPPDGLGVLYLSFGNRLDTAKLEWISNSGELQQKIPLYKGRSYSKTGTWGNTKLYRLNGHLRISEPPFDTIHVLDPDKGFVGATRIIIGENALPREIWFDSRRWRKEASNYKIVSWVLESENYIFFRSQGINFGEYIYNRFTKKVLRAKAIERNNQWYFGLKNDLDGGLPFFPNSISGKYMVGSTTPYLIETYLKGYPISPKDANLNPELRGRFEKLVQELKSNDNPVIVVVKMKE